MKLSAVAIRRPVFATMMVGALLVLGIFSYTDLAVDMFPEIDFPFVTVVTIYPGASAETVETEVTKKIEDASNEASAIRHISSISRESYSLVIIEFELERDGAEATQDVREKVAAIRGELPDDIDAPVVSQYDPGARPIISLVVSGDRPAREITELTKNRIRRRLESVNGIGNVRLVGGEEREIAIALDPEKMEAYGVTTFQVTNSIAAANMEIPGGRIDESSREYLIRMAGRLNAVGQFNDIIVKTINGVPVYLKDIARVIDTVGEQRSLSVFNKRRAVSLSLVKQSGANTVEVSSRVKAIVAELQEEMPPDVDIAIVNNDAKYIEDSVHEVLFNIQIGTLLAVVVIFLFLLSFRPTIITGLSIPISIVATFTVMKMLGFTINMMTLMGLSLAVGILIDDAIVVIENIFRHMRQGKSAMEAAFSGTKEIGLAVMATTLSIVAVFVPIAFMSGIVGRFFLQFGITVSVAVLISLFVAFTLTPMLSSRFLEEKKSMVQRRGLLAALSRGISAVWQPILKVLSVWNTAFEKTKPVYLGLLRGSLRRRWLVMLVAAASFIMAIYLATFLGSEFMTQTDEGRFFVYVDTPPGTDLAGTAERFNTVDDVVRQLDEVTETYITIGAGNDPVTRGTILVRLTDKDQRDVNVFELIDSTRVLLSSIPGIKFSIGTGGGHGSKSVELSIRGSDMKQLVTLVHEVQRIAYDTPGAIDIDNTLEEGKPELQVQVDRKKASDLGLSLLEIPMTVRTLVEGEVVSKFKDGDEEYDVRVRLDEPFRNTVEDVGRILIRSDKEIDGIDPFLVPVSRIADITKTSTVGEYNRYDREREVRVNANVLGGYFPGTVTNEIMATAAQVDLPPGYDIRAVGEAEIMAEAFANIFKALILAVIFIYMLLASQYGSFTDPLSIMLSLPLSLIGAIIGLTGQSLSIMSLIGIVLLMGLVTKNAILLIDFVKQLRAEGMPRSEAILHAGPIRLRPILMTTFAMVFGMLPLALGFGPGAELRAPMARAAIGGIISSTLLTLVVVPVVYTLIDDFVGLFKRHPAPN